MSGIEEVFTELLFGSGAWIGLTILLILCISGTLLHKYAGVFFGLILIFLGIEYLNNVNVTSNFYWSVLICWFSALFCFLRVVGEVRK